MKSNKIGEGIAFAALCIGCVILEIFGKGAGTLWILVTFWVLFSLM
jgi:hypothetical protein